MNVLRATIENPTTAEDAPLARPKRFAATRGDKYSAAQRS